MVTESNLQLFKCHKWGSLVRRRAATHARDANLVRRFLFSPKACARGKQQLQLRSQDQPLVCTHICTTADGDRSGSPAEDRLSRYYITKAGWFQKSTRLSDRKPFVKQQKISGERHCTLWVGTIMGIGCQHCDNIANLGPGYAQNKHD